MTIITQSQQKNLTTKLNLNALAHLPPISKKIVEAKVTFLKKSSYSTIRAFHLLYKFDREYDTVHFSQEFVAKQIGTTTETANRVIKQLWKAGLIWKDYRHGKTCIYRVDEMLAKGMFLRELNDIFKKLKLFQFRYVRRFLVPLFLLFSLQSKLAISLTYGSKTRYACATGARVREADFDGCLAAKKSLNQKKRVGEMNFTKEQLVQLAQFSTEALKYADADIKAQLASGREIKSLFGYFKAICQRFEADKLIGSQTKQKPINGKVVAPSYNPLYTAEEMAKINARGKQITQEVATREANVYTRKNQSATRIEETDYEFSDKVQAHVHRLVLENDKGIRVTKSLADIRLLRLPLEQQKELIKKYHTIDCPCYPDLSLVVFANQEVTAPPTPPAPVVQSSELELNHSDWQEVYD